jgi:hypothetical protein
VLAKAGYVDKVSLEWLETCFNGTRRFATAKWWWKLLLRSSIAESATMADILGARSNCPWDLAMAFGRYLVADVLNPRASGWRHRFYQWPRAIGGSYIHLCRHLVVCQRHLLVVITIVQAEVGMSRWTDGRRSPCSCWVRSLCVGGDKDQEGSGVCMCAWRSVLYGICSSSFLVVVTMENFILGGALGVRVSVSGVKTLGLIFDGFTW